MPSLHSQQVPSEVRQPNAGFTCGHFQIDGPHRLVSTAGTRRWLLAPEYMYPIERATKSGLVGPWRTPDIGELPVAGLNPGGIEPWGISNFQIFPNIEILIYGGWYLLYRYWPTSHNTHRFEAYTYFPPRSAVCASASNTKSPQWCSKSSRCRMPACSAAPRRHWNTALSTSFH